MYSCLNTAIVLFVFFFFHDTAPTEISTLSLHDALPIWTKRGSARREDRRPAARGPCELRVPRRRTRGPHARRSEEHTSELQSRFDLVCRLLLEKKKKRIVTTELKRYVTPKHRVNVVL